jgi:hypothetical protein
VITPPSLVALLERRWNPLVPLLHPSADMAPPAERYAGARGGDHALDTA